MANSGHGEQSGKGAPTLGRIGWVFARYADFTLVTWRP
jgi:hypothetical protein